MAVWEVTLTTSVVADDENEAEALILSRNLTDEGGSYHDFIVTSVLPTDEETD